MLAVHEEKITRQEETIFQAEEQIEVRRSELSRQIDELHSRITTNTKEIMTAASTQHEQQNKEIQKIKDELISRVGVLEKWRHVLIGSSIVAGFILHKFVDFST
jgi:arginine repressor